VVEQGLVDGEYGFEGRGSKRHLKVNKPLACEQTQGCTQSADFPLSFFSIRMHYAD
jgi:hypothetical protein